MGKLGFPFSDYAVPVINNKVNSGLQILFIFTMVLLKNFSRDSVKVLVLFILIT